MENNLNKKNSFCVKVITILVIIFLIFLPVGINLCYLKPAVNEIFEEPKKWTEFWGTYISALASFAMVVITWKTLKQNKEQLNELKRQWKEANSPKLECYLTNDTYINAVSKDFKGIKLEIINIGQSVAKDIFFQIVMDKSLKSSFEANNIEKIWTALTKMGNDNRFWLLPNETISFKLCSDEIEVKNNQPLEVYRIAGIEVSQKNYDNFYRAIEKIDKFKIKGKYNQVYDLDCDISMIMKRKSFISIDKAISNAGENISFAIYNINDKSKKDNYGTEQ